MKHHARPALAALLLGAAAMPAAQAAEPYPTKPIRLLVPFAPGGGTDILARVFGQKLTESFGQQVVIDNRPGAGGNLGTELAARATPDGHTMLMVSASFAVNAAIYKLAFDPVNDLAPITQVAAVPFVLLAHPSVAANNTKELIALAKAKPGSLNYASSGNGSAPHLAGALFTMMTGTSMVHVPYRGGAPAVTDLLAGQVQLLFSTVIQGLPHVKAGKLKPIAIAGLKRSAALPDVTTIAESGVTGYDVTNWFGLLVPRGTPPAVITRLNGEIVQHLKSQELRTRLAAEGADPVGGTAAEFGALIRNDIAKFTKVVKAAGIKVQ